MLVAMLVADAILKFHDTDDWGIDGETFSYIQEKFGRLDVDRFAHTSNAKLPRFDARFHCPGCETVDTFEALNGGPGTRDNSPFSEFS